MIRRHAITPAIRCLTCWRASWRIAPILAVIVVIGLVFLPLTPPYDLDVFRRAGLAALRGLPVYPRLNIAAVYSGSAFVYPYFTVWPFAALSWAPPTLAAGLFFALAVGAVTAATVGTTDDGRHTAALVLGSAFAVSGLQLGALSPLLFAGTLFLWKLRDRPLTFGLLAGRSSRASCFCSRCAHGPCWRAAAALSPMPPLPWSCCLRRDSHFPRWDQCNTDSCSRRSASTKLARDLR